MAKSVPVPKTLSPVVVSTGDSVGAGKIGLWVSTLIMKEGNERRMRRLLLSIIIIGVFLFPFSSLVQPDRTIVFRNLGDEET